MIQKNHSDEFDIEIRFRQNVTDEDIEKYDIVHFHRFIPCEDSLAMIKKFNNAGKITVCDIDDYWMPPHGHPIRQMAIAKKLPEQILENLKASTYVTTTTNIFAKHLKKRGLNVKVIPNAINHEMDMWQLKREESDIVRIGWIGGSSHEKDLAKLDGTFNKLFSDRDLEGKFQVVMCGYDTRGTITEIHPGTKQEKTRKIRPDESIWNKFELYFNNNGMAPENSYVRRNTLPINRYGEHYNYVDICLAPIVDNTFNEVKSELKIIETGIMKSALIASDIHIMAELLEHGKTGMLISSKKDHKDWYKNIKELILNKELRTALQNNLHDFVSPKYHLDEVTKMRCEWYKEILK